MYRQVSIVELIKRIQERVEAGTVAELVGSRPADTKRMYVQDYVVNLHCISPDLPSSVPVLKMIQRLQETMTEDVELPAPYQMLMQTNGGLSQVYQEETGERHAVIPYSFKIVYGFKCK